MKRSINSVLYIFIKSCMLRGCGNLNVVVVLLSMVINNCYFTSTLIRCVTFQTFSYKRAATLSVMCNVPFSHLADTWIRSALNCLQ